MKTEHDSSSNTSDSVKKQQQQPQPQQQQQQQLQIPLQSNVSLASIPQIILTEPTHGHDPQSQITSSSFDSPNSLSPPSPRRSLTSSPIPLPLTKDVLQRKNKLDRLFHQQNKSHPIEYSSLNNQVDERVTAGLGISTPSNNNNNNNKNLGSDLRSHNTIHSRGTTNIRSDTDKTLVQNPPLISNDSQWSHDLDMYRASISTSSRRKNSVNRYSVTTSVSGSSNRNSASMRPYSVNQRVNDANKRHHHDPYYANYQRPPENRDKANKRRNKNNNSKSYVTHYLIDVIQSAVNRVIFTRAPESKEMAMADEFEFRFATNKDLIKLVSPPEQTDANSMNKENNNNNNNSNNNNSNNNNNNNNNRPSTIIPISSSSPHHINARLSSNTTNNNNNSHNNNRHSWLSTQDGRSDFENDALSIIDRDFSVRSSLKEQRQHSENNRYYHPTSSSPQPVPQQPDYFHVQTEHRMLNPLQGYSLFLFGPENPLRITAWKFIRLRSIETVIFFLMVLHWFLMAVIPIKENREKTVFGAQWTHYPIMLIQACYSIEAICKIIAYGFIFPPTFTRSHVYNSITSQFMYYYKRPNMNDNNHDGTTNNSSFPIQQEQIHTNVKKKPNHKAYMCSFGNFIDLVSIIAYWIDFSLMIDGYPYISLFKSLGAMRPIRLLSLLPGTAVILQSLETGWDLLLAVSGLVCFFLLLFALIGLISFQGVFSRRCYYTTEANSLQLVEPPLYCSGYYNGTTVVGSYDVTTGTADYPGYNGYLCPSGQICIEDPANNPNYGFVNFDNIFFAFLATYTFVSLELWTELMSQTQSADSKVAALYYCLGVYIISFVMTFLLFAVVTSAFARVRALNSVSAFTAKKKGYPILQDTNDGLESEVIWKFENDLEEIRNLSLQKRLRLFMARLVVSRFFFYFGGFLVFCDLVFMCLRSFYASEATLELVDNAETAFTFIFVFEILIRMIGATSWLNFWSSKRNIFDLLLVISTCVIQLPMIQDQWFYKYLTIFQILRQYRLFICIPRVRRILSAAFGTGENIFYVMVFLILATALCSTIFMQMFGGDYADILPIDEPGNRFDTFWQAFVSLIVVYTTETWTAVLYNAMASQAGQGSIYAAIALSLYFAFGRYVMSGLYIAVVLENFELSDEYIRDYQIRDFIHRHRFKDMARTETILLKLFRPLYTLEEKKKISVTNFPKSLTAPLSHSDVTELLADIPKGKRNDDARPPSLFEKKVSQFFSSLKNHIPFMKKKTSIKAVPINTFVQDYDDSREDYDAIAAEENYNALRENIPVVRSLLFFSNRSRIRYYCKRLAGSSRDGVSEKKNLFNWLMMACVLVSILMVILDEPATRLKRRDTFTQFTYNAIEVTLSILFVIELAIRIIADGLLLTPSAYLRNYWNQLDFCVILLNIITIFMGSEEAPRGLSTARSFRILRLIRYFDSVRDIFVALFYAFPLMLDALLFTFLVLLPFAIYGVNIFGGLMWLCNDSTALSRGECIGEFLNDVSGDNGIATNILVPRTWQNPEVNFYSYDTFPIALQHLFTLTSTEGWVDSMFSAMSTPREPDMQPSFSWDSPLIYHGLFYIIFMIISQGTMQLFVGVIIEKFKERSGITTLTTPQRQYSDLRRLLKNVRPKIKAIEPKSKLRRFCYHLIKERRGRFNQAITCIIILNIIVLATEFQASPEWLNNFQDYAYLLFTTIYVLESIIKFLGSGWKKWLRSKWNWYNGTIAWCAFLLMILRFALPDLWTLRVERYCLILAAFRIGEGVDALQTLYHTIAKSLPSIIQVSAVFMVAMCLFAMIFMEFFGLTKYGVYGNENINFRDYGNALLLLVRATTGEAWNAILVDYTVSYPDCNNSNNYLENDCGSPFWAYFLFNIFYIICTHIFLNLFTAVIISNFEYAYETRTRFTSITKTDLRIFKNAWAEVDPRGMGYIQKGDLAKFLRLLDGRFKFRIYDDVYGHDHLLKLSKIGIASPTTSPGMEEKSGYSSGLTSRLDYNFGEVNRCLETMNKEVVRQRRFEYNICVKEILRTETSKGLPFASVLNILSYRFINISESLTLDPLIKRLEKLDQITQEYHLEKAAGFFLAQVQRKRYIKALWKKRDEDEVKRLGVTNASSFNFIPSSPESSPFLHQHYDTRNKKKRPPPVPSIVINNVSEPGMLTSPITPGSHSHFPASPMSNFSTEVQYDVSHSVSDASPPMDTDGTPYTTGTHALSPMSPLPLNNPFGSPSSRHHTWLLMDGNSEMPNEVSDGLMDSLDKSVWSDMLRHEEE